jgi:hypothetical protein
MDHGRERQTNVEKEGEPRRRKMGKGIGSTGGIKTMQAGRQAESGVPQR